MTVGVFTFTDAGSLACRKNIIDLENDTIVGVLVDAAHTPSVVNDDVYSDISANECDDADYIASFAEGHVITNIAWTLQSTRNFKLDADDLDFGNAVTIAAKYLYLLKRAGASLVAGDLIVGFMDLQTEGGNASSTNGNFDPGWDPTNGLFVDTLTP
jgi:hypothetical protein